MGACLEAEGYYEHNSNRKGCLSSKIIVEIATIRRFGKRRRGFHAKAGVTVAAVSPAKVGQSQYSANAIS